MYRCRRRERILADEQYRTILIAIQDRKGAVVAEVGDCAIHEQLVEMGFLKFVREVPGYRRYQATGVATGPVQPRTYPMKDWREIDEIVRRVP
jgi:hypothetical protein